LASPRTTDAVLRDLGKRISAARAVAGLTQEEASARAEIDYKRYQRIEAGSVNVTVKTLVRIASAFEITFLGLFSEPRRARRPRSRRS
jgi:transcriptional regulator with XRE-family HTH domain